MPDYVLIYRQPGYGTRAPLPDEVRGEWHDFLTGLGDSLVQMGDAVFSAASVGTTDGTMVSGYSLIRADSLDEATKLAADCPVLGRGGGVEVGEITPVTMPAETANA